MEQKQQTKKDHADQDYTLGTSVGQLILRKELEYFGPHSRLIGILLILLGMLGLMMPSLASLASEGAISGVLIAAGILWGVHTAKSGPSDIMSWMKSLVLLAAGAGLMIFPLRGVAALVIFLGLYLTFDAVSSFTYAQRRRPEKGWGWMVFNGVIDLLLATVFLIGWPETSLFMLGIYVAISLIFDGWALIMIGSHLRPSSGNAGSPKE